MFVFHNHLNCFFILQISDHLLKWKTNSETEDDINNAVKSVFEFYDKDKDGSILLKEFSPNHDEL